MRYILSLVLFVLLLRLTSVHGQSLLNENGLLYTTADLEYLNGQARQILKKHKVHADSGKAYFSRWQAYGTHYWISGPTAKRKQLEELRGAVIKGISEKVLLGLSRKFKVKKRKDIPLRYTNEMWLIGDSLWNNSTIITTPYGPEFAVPTVQHEQLRPGWSTVSEIHCNDENECQIGVLFISSQFEQKRIPSRFSRLIEYTYSLLDTSEPLYLAKECDWSFVKGWTAGMPTVQRFWDRMNFDHLPGRPNYDSIAKAIAADPKLFEEFKLVVDELLANMKSNYLIEDLAGKLISPETELALKLRRRPCVNACLLDYTFFFHLRMISVLAAQTHNFPIWLQAHFELMQSGGGVLINGHYAKFFPGRHSFVKELEALTAINTSDFLLGVIFETKDRPIFSWDPSVRLGNQPDVFSRGIGSVLSDIGTKKEFEKKVLDIIFAPDMDDLNRDHFLELYKDYIDELQDRNYARSLLKELKRRSKDLPLYFQEDIREMKMVEDEEI